MQAKKYFGYIYLITNLINHKVYVGKHEWTGIYLSPTYFCSSKDHDFWDDIRKYEGIDIIDDDELREYSHKHYKEYKNFSVTMIQHCYSNDSLNIMERLWIRCYRRILGRDNVYNINDGGNGGWSGVNQYLKEHPKIRSDQNRKRIEDGTHPFLNLDYSPEKRMEINAKMSESARIRYDNDPNHPLKNLSFDELSDRSRKAIETMGPEVLSARASKIAKTQLANGTHPFQNLTTEQCSERGKKCAENLGSEGCHNRSLKAAATQKIEWVFFNPINNTYKVHNLYWKTRLKEGYTKRLCYFSNWPQYCIDNNLDPNLINEVSNS